MLPNYYINFFDMYRVVAFDEVTTSELKTVDFINDRIGYQQHTSGATKYYPKSGGIGAWTEFLLKKAVNAGVEVMLETQVSKIVERDSSFIIHTDNDVFEVDNLVWTISSALLTRYLPLKSKLERPEFRVTALCDFVFEKPLTTECNYINNFDASLLSTRLTCYQNLVPESGFFGVTVEVLLDEMTDDKALLSTIEREIRQMGLATKDNSCLYRNYRPVKEGFPVISLENDRRLKALNEELSHEYKNITLLGRSSSKGFFMSELLLAAYQSTQSSYQNQKPHN